MGARLVGAAYHSHWSQTLTPVERIVLIAMCLTALDNSRDPKRPAMQYHGGEEALVIALDGDLPPIGSTAYETRTVAVNKVVGQLIRKGAIERLVRGRPGHVAVYKLTLDSHLQPSLLDDAQPVDNSRSNVRPLRKTGGGQHHPLGGGQHHPKSDNGW